MSTGHSRTIASRLFIKFSFSFSLFLFPPSLPERGIRWHSPFEEIKDEAEILNALPRKLNWTRLSYLTFRQVYIKIKQHFTRSFSIYLFYFISFYSYPFLQNIKTIKCFSLFQTFISFCLIIWLGNNVFKFSFIYTLNFSLGFVQNCCLALINLISKAS